MTFFVAKKKKVSEMDESENEKREEK